MFDRGSVTEDVPETLSPPPSEIQPIKPKTKARSKRPSSKLSKSSTSSSTKVNQLSKIEDANEELELDDE